MDGFLFLEAIKTPYVPAAYDEHLFLWWLTTEKKINGPWPFFPSPFFFLTVVGEGERDWIGLWGIEDDEASAETSWAAEALALAVRRESILLSKQILACIVVRWWCWRSRNSLPESWLESQSSMSLGSASTMMGSGRGLACGSDEGWVGGVMLSGLSAGG